MADWTGMLRRVVKDPRSLRNTKHYLAQQRRLRTADPSRPFEETNPGLEGAAARALRDGHGSTILVVGRADRDAADIVVAAGMEVVVATLDRDVSASGIPLLEDILDSDAVPACIIVASPLPQEYGNVLRVAVRHSRYLPVYCDRTGFEWVGGEMPILAAADDGDHYLHNYFPEHFGIKDPLQVRIDVWADGRQTARMTRIMAPNETWILRESDLPLGDRQHAFLRVRCWHPALTRGRHRRLRFASDIHFQGAMATLHGAHDFGPPHPHWSQIVAHVGQEVDTRLAIPDYDGGADGEDGYPMALRLVAGDQTSKPSFPASKRIQEFSIMDEVDPKHGIVQYAFLGYGTPFWYTLGTGPDGAQLAANHHVNTLWEADAAPAPTAAARARYEALDIGGIRFHPYPLPVVHGRPWRAGIRLGHTMPAPSLSVRWHDAGGRFVTETKHDAPGHQVLYPEDLDAEAAKKCLGGLAYVSFDWRRDGITPDQYRPNVELVVTSRAGADWDSTEFQGTWKNLRGYIADHPRWMFPPGVNTARTNLVMRGVETVGLHTCFVAVNASGDLAYDHGGRAEILFYRPDGESIRTIRDLGPWQCALWDLADLFPNLASFCPDGRGFVRVRSHEVDLSMYAVTTTNEGGVSVQHLWGY